MAITKTTKKRQEPEMPTEQPQSLDKSISEAPFFYVDSLLSLSLGPYVSKATFGQQIQGSTTPPKFKASVTLVLPTNAMFDMASAIVSNFANGELADKLASDHSRLKAALDHIVQPNS